MDTRQIDKTGGRIPIGISTLDTMFDGGVPRGSSILLSGEVGAGAPEFVYTSSAMVSMAKHDPESFGMYNETDVDESNLPKETHYVSFTRSEKDVLGEMENVLNDEMYEILVDNLVFKDFSDSYFHNTLVPNSWVNEDIMTLKSLGSQTGSEKEDLLSNIADYLEENAPNSLVVLDSLTGLVRATRHKLDWGELLILLAGLQKACKKWNGLLYALLDKNTLTEREHEEIASIFDGVLYFQWDEGDMERQRTMFVGSFRGMMAELGDDQDDKYETHITRDGFEISSIRKIG